MSDSEIGLRVANAIMSARMGTVEVALATGMDLVRVESIISGAIHATVPDLLLISSVTAVPFGNLVGMTTTAQFTECDYRRPVPEQMMEALQGFIELDERLDDEAIADGVHHIDSPVQR